ncbi:hypothetical protein [Zavarzinella formosa]|uniref:hypothetical protein n=1 Tax=Zavarzinella formosa TaxID=360055 RepID=UPI0002D5D8EF|nr:hypothetical protein [Zavarzinella formosa]
MFFIVWRGYGPLAFIPLLLPLVAFGAMAESNYSGSAAIIVATITLAIGGAGVILVSRLLKSTGEPNDLYFIPLRYWGLIYIVGGLGLAVWQGYLVSQHGWKN